MTELVDRLQKERILTKEEFVRLIECRNEFTTQYLFSRAREVRERHFGNKVYIRGLIEFTNYCKNDCFYCGIRAGNKNAARYRLSKAEILDACKIGYSLGFRTFVLQGGEDRYFTDSKIVDIVSEIKQRYPDCAITLSIGEKSYESYLAYFNAGADRYLLRHESADPAHYSALHPPTLKLQNRIRCLYDLKDIGYQVGTGFMVGSPYQNSRSLAEDLHFISRLRPEMIGIGPFVPHCESRFSDFAGGTAELTLFLLAVLRLMLPCSLLPATTALGTIEKNGRQLGMLAGANVVMPNLSPKEVRDKYSLYDNKLSSGGEAAESISLLKEQMQEIGYRVVVDRGDFPTNSDKI